MDRKILTPPPMRGPFDSKPEKAAYSALEMVGKNLNLIHRELNNEINSVKDLAKEIREEVKSLRADLATEKIERQREGLAAKLWVGVLVSFATILSNLFFKFFT